jgi:hypothetical protein
MYTIKIIYDTGDSFHQEDGVEDFLAYYCPTTYKRITMEWNDKEKAKQAIKAIKEHYDYYKAINGRWMEKKEIEDIIKNAKKSKWACYDKMGLGVGGKRTKKEKIVRNPSEYKLMLELDNGERVEGHCFWCGYFESLVGADIVSKDEGESFRL